MIKHEIISLVYNKKKLLLIIFILGVICIDAYLVYQRSFLHEYHINPNYNIQQVLNESYTPASAAFLSGASHGHIPQEIIIWLLPIYILFLYGDSYTNEKKRNAFQILKIRCSQRKIYGYRLLSAFIIGFVISFIACLMNYIICIFVFHDCLLQKESAIDMITILSSQYPNISYIIYIIIFSSICGLLSSSLTGLSFMITMKIPLYTISFGVWYFQIINKYSITYLIQPFQEFGLSYMIPAGLIFLLICIVFILLGYIRVRYDESV